MPNKAMKGCNYAGCPNLIAKGRYCTEHQPMSTDMERGSAASRGYDARHRKLRAMVLARDPICRDPFGVHARRSEIVLSTDADHIVPKSSGGADSLENMQGLCHRCHSRKTAMQSSGCGRGGKISTAFGL